ncbi:MAG: TIGR03013 family XrtA/PEP-CTERM system glycosyltransferase [Thermodesulfobacteriota bacterium]|nr:TIGR03013 family XrtA/PEP-CTERM system glycosyltransferase [Thermodesulfobacteriota bacterium]
MLKIFNQYYPIRNIIFFLMESVLIFLSVMMATWLRLGSDYHLLTNYTVVIPKALLIAVVCQLSLYYFDLYDFRVTDSNIELGIRLLQSLGSSSIALAVLYYLFPSLIIGKGIFIITLSLIIVLIVSWRMLYNWILKSKSFSERVLILGSGELASDIAREILERKDSGFFVVGFLEGEEKMVGVSIVNPKVIGTYGQLLQVVDEEKIDRIVVAIQQRRGQMPVKDLLECRLKRIRIEEGTSFYERLTGKIPVQNIYPSWLIFSGGFRRLIISNTAKRVFEMIVSVCVLFFFLPIILFTSILIKIDSKGPVFFTQKRAGKDGKVYRLIKFRSMRHNAESETGPVWAQVNDNRITRVGRIIRKARIDEIPQIFNVLKGDMSIVGPRPERPFFVKKLEKKIPYYSQRLCVKPGVTGWAQIKYNYGASEEDSMKKLQYDMYYIKNMSVCLDILIIFETIKVVLFGKGAR